MLDAMVIEWFHGLIFSLQELDMHPSILYRSAELPALYERMDDYEYKVEKIGDKCSNFEEYYCKAIINLKLDSVLKVR